MKRLVLALIGGLLTSVASAQVVIPDRNILPNSDFMSRDPLQRPLRWNIGTGLQTATITGAEHHSERKDDQSLRVTDTSIISGVQLRTEKRIAAPNTNYKASIWVKGPKATGTFSLEFWDQDNKKTGSVSTEAKPGTEWQQLELNLKAPDKTAHVTVSIVTGKEATGVSFWDDVSLMYTEDYQPQVKKGQRELFMDDYRIAKLVDVQRVVNQGVKSKILIGPAIASEGTSAYIYGTVLYNQPAGTGYRMWYTSVADGKYFLCYATSKDGMKWVKPSLGVYDFKGNKQNNVVFEGGGTIVYDPKDKDPERRYKLMAFDPAKERFGYNIRFSADGLHWKDLYPKPVLPYGDVSNVAYDEARDLFIATTKQRMLVSNTSVTPGKMDRMAFVSVSKDFINWSAPDAPGSPYTLAVEGDPEDDATVRGKGGIESNVYGMPVYPYQGAYIGLPWMFDIRTYNNGVFANTGDGNIQPQVAYSRDLKHWARPIRDAVLPVGKAGSWDDGTLYTASTMQVSDREMSIYYGAMNLPHGGSASGMTQYARIAKATWRRDGMVSMYNGGDDPGSITTTPIQFDGRQLHINTKLNTGGTLKVELLDENDQPIPGYTGKDAAAITGDQFNAVAAWKNGSDLSKLSGKTIRLRFNLNGGNVYSYWFE